MKQDHLPKKLGLVTFNKVGAASERIVMRDHYANNMVAFVA